MAHFASNCTFLSQIGLSVGDVNRILQSAKMEQHAMQVSTNYNFQDERALGCVRSPIVRISPRVFS